MGIVKLSVFTMCRYVSVIIETFCSKQRIWWSFFDCLLRITEGLPWHGFVLLVTILDYLSWNVYWSVIVFLWLFQNHPSQKYSFAIEVFCVEILCLLFILSHFGVGRLSWSIQITSLIFHLLVLIYKKIYDGASHNCCCHWSASSYLLVWWILCLLKNQVSGLYYPYGFLIDVVYTLAGLCLSLFLVS